LKKRIFQTFRAIAQKNLGAALDNPLSLQFNK